MPPPRCTTSCKRLSSITTSQVPGTLIGIRSLSFQLGTAIAASGTGFFISPDGLAVTNFHVIQGASHLSGRTNEGAVFQFERVVAHPSGVDLAILKFAAEGVACLKLGHSTEAVEGQTVLVIGSPEGLQGTVTEGIISAFRENRSMIQISAPISPGSSGSPVMDESGDVIGVATLVTKEGQNLGFAIAVEEVERALTAPRVAIETPSVPPPVESTQPSSTESNPNETADRLLRAVATDFVESGNSLSIGKEMALYAARVDYYGQGVKSFEEIRADLSKYRKKWPSRRYEVSGIVRSEYDSKNDVGTVIVGYNFEVSNGAKRKTGEGASLLVFESLLRQPRLVLVKEYVAD
jgi:Trypsin-like peptidase domain